MLQSACKALLHGGTLGDMNEDGHVESSLSPGPARLGRFVESCRRRKGLKQGELAKAAGVDAAYLSQVEAGNRNWPQAVIPKIAAVLGVHQAYFAYEAGVITEDPSSLAHQEEPFESTDPRAGVLACARRMSDQQAALYRRIGEAIVAGGDLPMPGYES